MEVGSGMDGPVAAMQVEFDLVRVYVNAGVMQPGVEVLQCCSAWRLRGDRERFVVDVSPAFHCIQTTIQ